MKVKIIRKDEVDRWDANRVTVYHNTVSLWRKNDASEFVNVVAYQREEVEEVEMTDE